MCFHSTLLSLSLSRRASFKMASMKGTNVTSNQKQDHFLAFAGEEGRQDVKKKRYQETDCGVLFAFFLKYIARKVRIRRSFTVMGKKRKRKWARGRISFHATSK